ncbi:MAG: acyl-CoA dehydrogenase [Thermodesulfobacteriota bacterium]
MTNLLVDERDVRFVLYEQLEIERLCEKEKYSEFSRDLFDMVLDAAVKLSENELWPANGIGDEIGVRLDNGRVHVPEQFKRLYSLYCEGGWPALSVDPEHGGQGFPIIISCAALEAFVAANLAFMSYPGLTVGAARVIEKFGTEEFRRTYMDRMYSGQWTGTMCLTEPQAGSDVGALRTRAKKNEDGTYSIEGSKIFISCGDHDLAENVVHLVLARTEGAPPGTKGISIFIVPRLREENGTLIDNDVTTVAVEKKLGIHGSATCALNFGEKGNCIGYLLGTENSGMRIMFQMMNEARLGVGIQGLALASGAYMHALRYANDRTQGPHFTSMRDGAAPKIQIIDHPDVRRMLMWMKCTTEGMRALLYYAGYCEDCAETAATEEEAAAHRGMIELLIPVCKSWCTDIGFRVTEMALQVHGGYGYCREYPAEQFLRDIKITSIYEGTNGIQAMDLVGRKLPMNGGVLFQNFMRQTGEIVERTRGISSLKAVVDLFDEARKRLVEVTTFFLQKCMSGDLVIPVLFATPYQELFGDVAVGYMLLWQAEIADRKLSSIFAESGANTPEKKIEVLTSNKEAAFYRGKVASAEFFANTFLSLAPGKAKSIISGERSAIELPRESLLRS